MFTIWPVDLKYTCIENFLDDIHVNGCNIARNLQSSPQIGGVVVAVQL